MFLPYRKHLILLTINQDEFTGAWVGSLHIQYTEKLKFRNVLIQGGIFWTENGGRKAPDPRSEGMDRQQTAFARREIASST